MCAIEKKSINNHPISAEEEASRQQLVKEDLAKTIRELAGVSSTVTELGTFNYSLSWEIASELVEKVDPVPWIIWSMVRSVFGCPTKIGEPCPLVFSPLSHLINRAVEDPIIGKGVLWKSNEQEHDLILGDAVNFMGSDVAAALCFIYAVCRKTRNLIGERVWRPIVDDALLRAQIGFIVGDSCAVLGTGRGLLAGFVGRCGLAIQIASGSSIQAQQAIESMASGLEIRDVGLRVYGSDPLQVAAMTLTVGGCSRDAAYGVVSFSLGEDDIVNNPIAHIWFSAFSAIEHLRMGQADKISERCWQDLGLQEKGRVELIKKIQKVMRQGNLWDWATKSLDELHRR